MVAIARVMTVPEVCEASFISAPTTSPMMSSPTSRATGGSSCTKVSTRSSPLLRPAMARTPVR